MYRVLIVDDDPDIRTIVSQVLERDDFVTTVANNANDALACLQSSDIDLVMTDICMDGMDGLSLTREIRSIYPDIPAIVMTGHASMDSAVDAIRSGACDYLVKPFEDFDTIIRTAYRALDTVESARKRDRLIDTLTDSNKALRELAIRDGLTGVYNHRHLVELLTAEFERAARYERDLSLLFVDVDHFKNYNDTQGHQQGDNALRAIATLLQKITRHSDALGRWGGEEFVILSPETALEAAGVLAEKLREAVAALDFPGREAQPGGCLSVSIGVASMQKNETAETLISRADKALYQAKSAGRNVVQNAA